MKKLMTTKDAAGNLNRQAQLVRAAVLAIKALQQAGEVAVDIMPIQEALEALDAALHGKRVKCERVVIAVRDGCASIESQSNFVEVVIKDYDARIDL